jgi:hypothetical protein
MSSQLSGNEMIVESPLGKRLPDSAGSPVGVVRVDPGKSYAGVGALLQQVINASSEEAWDAIKAKIDYTFESLELALKPLREHTGLEEEIKRRLNKGQKMLFKPNLVNPMNIDFQTHGPGLGSSACTEWPFIAALMRWFHERLGVRYHQMALGEAATSISAMAGLFSLMNPEGKAITPEAVIEGKSDDYYFGWGFYFVRKYLAECGFEPGDDPMRGFEASVSGAYAPPGKVDHELRVYDLNRISDDPQKGREVNVPGGVNFPSITLHKAVIGGDPADAADREAYPGCILVNVPKFKVHIQALFTNVIKNLGIGLYPMQFSRTGDCCWEYSNPHHAIPGMKGGIPHEVWVADMDMETCLPKLDRLGKPIVRKTGGLTATMIDINKAVQNQDIFMIHVVDGIEATNLDHQGTELAIKTAEGMIFAGLDPVATDLLCARYMFSNVPMKEALESEIDDGAGGRFPQAVPVPVLEGRNIVTAAGYDCPLARYNCFAQAEARGLGARTYHALGWDMVAHSPIVSVDGHLGSVKDGIFIDIVTKTLFFDCLKFFWDLQKTALGYFSACDELTGSSLKKDLLAAFDEDGDGIVRYDETGKKGIASLLLHQGGYMVSCLATDPFAVFSARAKTEAKILKLGSPQRNPHGYDYLQEYSFGSVCMMAYRMSQMETESPDLFVPGMSWGRGKWPSFQAAQFIGTGTSLYGQDFPLQIAYPSLYGSALFYADLTQNEGKYVGASGGQMTSEPILHYLTEMQKGGAKPLDFVFHVPPGFDKIGGASLPNVVATEDPARVLTVWFRGGAEVWGKL